jgi:hypothetical protein
VVSLFFVAPSVEDIVMLLASDPTRRALKERTSFKG